MIVEPEFVEGNIEDGNRIFTTEEEYLGWALDAYSAGEDFAGNVPHEITSETVGFYEFENLGLYLEPKEYKIGPRAMVSVRYLTEGVYHAQLLRFYDARWRAQKGKSLQGGVHQVLQYMLSWHRENLET